MSLEIIALLIFVGATSLFFLVSDKTFNRICKIVAGIAGLVYVVIVIIKAVSINV